MRSRYYTFIVCSLLILFLYVNQSDAKDIIDANSVELIDETGQPVTINSYDGYFRLVFFGYTHCPDICPLTLYYVATALKSLGPQAEQLKVLFISIDPKRDTPAILAQYTDSFHPLIIGLTGSYDDIKATTSGFRTTFGYSIVVDGKERPLSQQDYESISADAAYVPYHSSQIYMLGTDGQLLDIIGYGSTPDDIAAKIREYIDTD